MKTTTTPSTKSSNITPAKGATMTKKTSKASSSISTKPLIGMTFCITGRTDTTRNELERIISNNGGTYSAAVNSKCSHLLIADPSSTTAKANNARSFGIKLISEEQFFGMVNEAGSSYFNSPPKKVSTSKNSIKPVKSSIAASVKKTSSKVKSVSKSSAKKMKGTTKPFNPSYSSSAAV